MTKLTQQALEARFQAKEVQLRREAKLAAIAEDPDAVLGMSVQAMQQALGEDSGEITVRELVELLRPLEKVVHAGNGTRLVGEAREQMKRTILELLEHYGGLGCRDISQMLSLPSRRVGAMLKQMREAGQIRSEGQKVATVYFLPSSTD